MNDRRRRVKNLLNPKRNGPIRAIIELEDPDRDDHTAAAAKAVTEMMDKLGENEMVVIKYRDGIMTKAVFCRPPLKGTPAEIRRKNIKREITGYLSEITDRPIEKQRQTMAGMKKAGEAYEGKQRRLQKLDEKRYRAPPRIDDAEYDRLAPTAKNDKHLAGMLGVHPSTLSRYKARRGIS